MIPVMTSTKTDRFAIDLAGVEAGAKIFVPLADEPGSLAHAATADQKIRNIVCARNRKVEDFIFNIDISLLPFSTSEMRAITRLRNLSLILIAKRAPQFLPFRVRLNEEQVCYQRDKHSYFVHRNRGASQHSRNLDH